MFRLYSGIIPPLEDETKSCSSVHEEPVSSSQIYADEKQNYAKGSDDNSEENHGLLNEDRQEDNTNQQIPVKERNLRKKPRTSEERLIAKRQKHPLLSPCAENCRKKCRTLFTEEERYKIHDEFWNMHHDTQRQWLLARICKMPVQRKRPSTLASAEKSFSLVYTFLNNSANEIKVCQTFFIQTLGYSSNRIIVELLKNSEESVGGMNKVQSDKRGRHIPANKKDHSVILKHIEKYNPQVSHYRREHAPNRRYITSETNLKNMFEDFKSRNPDYKCTYSTHYAVFKKENIGFGEPKEDMCDVCAVYKNLNANEFTDSVSSSQTNHIAKVREARNAYNEDKTKEWSSTTRVYAVDLQKVLLLPMISGLKSCIFTPRLVVFNETFASIKEKELKEGKVSTAKDKHYAVLWDESTAGRNKEHVTNAYLSLIKKERDANAFVFWTDNCAAQNKNWSLYNAMAVLVNSDNGVNSINFKYLTAGHTFMAADGIHGHIEKSLRRQGDVYDYEDLKMVIQNSVKRLETLDINRKDFFFNIPSINRQRKTRSHDEQDIPYLEALVDVKFERGVIGFHYKTTFSTDYQFCNFIKKTVKLSSELLKTPLDNCPRGLSSEKKKNIVEKLVCKMPQTRREFWINMPENSKSEDLLKMSGF